MISESISCNFKETFLNDDLTLLVCIRFSFQVVSVWSYTDTNRTTRPVQVLNYPLLPLFRWWMAPTVGKCSWSTGSPCGCSPLSCWLCSCLKKTIRWWREWRWRSWASITWAFMDPNSIHANTGFCLWASCWRACPILWRLGPEFLLEDALSCLLLNC